MFRAPFASKNGMISPLSPDPPHTNVVRMTLVNNRQLVDDQISAAPPREARMPRKSESSSDRSRSGTRRAVAGKAVKALKGVRTRVTVRAERVEAVPLARGTAPVAAAAGALVDRIKQFAGESEIATFRWRDRGRAPGGYIKGMALVFARVCCKLEAGDPAAVDMAKAATGDGNRDALTWYAEIFDELGMPNDRDGPDTLRHLFVLMIGLGMRESSGKHCEGRDRSADNTTAGTAEAGLFQTSFNARSASPLMPQLFATYRANPAGFLDTFQEGVRCSAASLENFGRGDGREYQRLAKECPAFHAEFTAVGLRHIRKHWGPITRRAAQVRPECDGMLRGVQDLLATASPVEKAALL
jgi:hypothetical protein